MVARQTGVIAAVLLAHPAKEQTGTELLVRDHLELVEEMLILLRQPGAGGQLVVLRQLQQRAQVEVIFEPLDLNGRLAVEHLAHEHEAHACRWRRRQ